MLISFMWSELKAQPNENSLKIADSFYFAANWNKAIETYEQILSDTSTNSVAWQRLAFAYYSLNETDEALKNFKKSEASTLPHSCSLIYTQEWLWSTA
jgi:tetratricopeptide (TPR) repeat protein